MVTTNWNKVISGIGICRQIKTLKYLKKIHITAIIAVKTILCKLSNLNYLCITAINTVI